MVEPLYTEEGGVPAVSAVAGGAVSGPLTGRIVSRPFLGAIARVKNAADIPSARAGAFPVGLRVFRFAPDAARLLPLGDAPAVSA